MLTGRCLCARVRFEIHGKLYGAAYCHCTICRRAGGSAFLANARLRAVKLTWSSARDTIVEYESSPGKFRAFCRNCGSPIYARRATDPDWISIRLGLLEGDPGVRPQAHFNVASKAPWFSIADDLPQYPGDTDTDHEIS